MSISANTNDCFDFRVIVFIVILTCDQLRAHLVRLVANITIFYLFSCHVDEDYHIGC